MTSILESSSEQVMLEMFGGTHDDQNFRSKFDFRRKSPDESFAEVIECVTSNLSQPIPNLREECGH